MVDLRMSGPIGDGVAGNRKVCGCGTASLSAVLRSRQAQGPCPVAKDRAARFAAKLCGSLRPPPPDKPVGFSRGEMSQVYYCNTAYCGSL